MSPLVELPTPEYEYGNPEVAFKEALQSGRLSQDINRPNFVGNYMYMGTKKGKALFKHANTRAYLP